MIFDKDISKAPKIVNNGSVDNSHFLTVTYCGRFSSFESLNTRLKTNNKYNPNVYLSNFISGVFDRLLKSGQFIFLAYLANHVSTETFVKIFKSRQHGQHST